MKCKAAIALCLGGFFLYSCSSSKEAETPKKQPNILFYITDDQSIGHTSFEGATFINTPAFDRVAKNGIFFTNCYAGSPGCAPSRSSIVTGRYPWQNEQSGQHASSWMKKYVSFIDELALNGYHTGRTGKGVDPFQFARNEKDSLWRKDNPAGPAYNSIVYTDHNDPRTGNGIHPINYFENFKSFLIEKDSAQPFFFWFGAYEPHRPYEANSWKNSDKKLSDVQVPDFLPEHEIVKSDLLDYAIEIEWADHHLMQMITYLDEQGELDNTIIIATSDNGMPFPRAKANSLEYGSHVPLAIWYPKTFKGGRKTNIPVSFTDLAPTILEVTGTTPKSMQAITGKSLVPILKNSSSSEWENRKYVATGRERHSSSQYNNYGYPQRAIRSEEYLLVWNVKPERWPAGAPQKYDDTDTSLLLGMHGLDAQGHYIKQAAYNDIDDCPTKTFLIENRENDSISPYFEMAVAKRPEYELYNTKTDPYCINNLAGSDSLTQVENELKRALMNLLTETKDPRVVGPDKEIFDSYKRYSPIRKYPKPE